MQRRGKSFSGISVDINSKKMKNQHIFQKCRRGSLGHLQDL